MQKTGKGNKMSEKETMEELSDTLEVSGVTLTLYAGVIGKIDEAIGGFYNVDKLPMNTELQMKLVKSIVTKYDENGNACGVYLKPFELSPKDFQKIYEWGLKHYQVFILTSSINTVEMLKKLEEKAKDLKMDL